MSRFQSQDKAFLQNMAEGITKRGLSGFALLILEVGRPLSFLGGQLLWLFQPGLSILWRREQITELAQLLEKPESVDTLIGYLKTERRYE